MMQRGELIEAWQNAVQRATGKRPGADKAFSRWAGRWDQLDTIRLWVKQADGSSWERLLSEFRPSSILLGIWWALRTGKRPGRINAKHNTLRRLADKLRICDRNWEREDPAYGPDCELPSDRECRVWVQHAGPPEDPFASEDEELTLPSWAEALEKDAADAVKEREEEAQLVAEMNRRDKEALMLEQQAAEQAADDERPASPDSLERENAATVTASAEGRSSSEGMQALGQDRTPSKPPPLSSGGNEGRLDSDSDDDSPAPSPAPPTERRRRPY
ncbi:hypothetical protein WJX73_004135 [Symbiochloris irregularis]|uniref:Uncharacterized protein n=1 Tax=Symbiochloris irregularis TaxID=706552 RepID=A0AAW1NTK2_9CHLO